MNKNTIRVISTSFGIWSRLGDGKAGVLASSKSEGIKILKELYPGDYEIIDIRSDDNKSFKPIKTDTPLDAYLGGISPIKTETKEIKNN